jgi:hypothetical protein
MLCGQAVTVQQSSLKGIHQITRNRQSLKKFTETSLRMGREGIKGNDGGGEFN